MSRASSSESTINKRGEILRPCFLPLPTLNLGPVPSGGGDTAVNVHLARSSLKLASNQSWI